MDEQSIFWRSIKRIAGLKDDTSEYVRKSVGNALRDISKKFPELIRVELNEWDLEKKEISQVYKLASKFIRWQLRFTGELNISFLGLKGTLIRFCDKFLWFFKNSSDCKLFVLTYLILLLVSKWSLKK